tara:strand:- start:1626 stop:1898 length:273 start_codon:yes stop_codon:yes gene_type:complete
LLISPLLAAVAVDASPEAITPNILMAQASPFLDEEVAGPTAVGPPAFVINQPLFTGERPEAQPTNTIADSINDAIKILFIFVQHQHLKLS